MHASIQVDGKSFDLELSFAVCLAAERLEATIYVGLYVDDSHGMGRLGTSAY